MKLRIFGGPILHAAQRMQDGRVVPIIEETPVDEQGGAGLSPRMILLVADARAQWAELIAGSRLSTPSLSDGPRRTKTLAV